MVQWTLGNQGSVRSNQSQEGELMFNIRLPIMYRDLDLEVGETEGILFIIKIKTKRQRKFRTLAEYYREVNGIRLNSVDSMLESFGRSEKSIQERFEEENELINKLGIHKEEVAELFKRSLIKEIEMQDFF